MCEIEIANYNKGAETVCSSLAVSRCLAHVYFPNFLHLKTQTEIRSQEIPRNFFHAKVFNFSPKEPKTYVIVVDVVEELIPINMISSHFNSFYVD